MMRQPITEVERSCVGDNETAKVLRCGDFGEDRAFYLRLL